MIKNTRDYNAAECMVWMYANNKDKIDIHMPEDYPRYLISFVPANQLRFPNGWYYSEKTRTINNQFSNIKVHVIIKE